VTAEGIGSYVGFAHKGFTIKPMNIAGNGLELSQASFTYDGKAHKPTVRTVGGKVLKEGLDYTVSYSNAGSKMAGSYTASVTGKGNYTGASAKAAYEIKAASLKGARLVLSKSSYGYDGKTHKPTVKTVGGKKLKAGEDYTVKYSKDNPKNAGVYTVFVTGKGNYAGVSANAKYRIAKAKNTMKAKGKTLTIKASVIKKSKTMFSPTKALSVTSAKGKVIYSKVTGNSKITVAKNGKVTVAKGVKPGAYKVKVTVKATGNTNYSAANKTVTITVKVK